MWTCGPFAKVRRDLEMFNFKMIQTAKFQDILEEIEQTQVILENGTDQEKVLAALLKLDLEEKLMLLIGGKDYVETKNNKIPRKTISRLVK